MTGLNSTLQLNVIANLVATLDLAEAAVPLTKTYRTDLTSGVVAGTADVVWHDTRTIAPSGTDDLDLAGSIAGLLGGTATFVKIKGLIIAAAAANVNNCVVGAAAANPLTSILGATHTLQIRPGAVFAVFAGALDAAGYAVVAATGDILRIANGAAGTSVTYDIIVIGTSA
jgi:hypothetical protein